MAPLTKKKTIVHFTHPGHQLSEVFENQEYLCDGCKTHGIGTRYRCNACDFDLHEHCGTCPMTLSTFLHPQHQLQLVVRKPQGTRQIERICDVCGDHVEGLFYRCKLCEFDVHPLCTQLPQDVGHVLHPQHPLRLQQAPSGYLCMVCQSECTGWRYRCAVCNCIDIHVGCVLIPCDSNSSPSPSTSMSAPSTSRSVKQPGTPQGLPTASPFGGGYAYGVPNSFGTVYPYYNYAVPSGYGTDPYNMYHQAPYGSNQQAAPGGGKKTKKMYLIVGKLALGVVTNIVFGAIGLS
ncbi:hypothetical protein Q3G72_020736 [Acer saccharum]|nr:hypothetical protein Q3G72_020736 [Acer saccharum]